MVGSNLSPWSCTTEAVVHVMSLGVRLFPFVDVHSHNVTHCSIRKQNSILLVQGHCQFSNETISQSGFRTPTSKALPIRMYGWTGYL